MKNKKILLILIVVFAMLLIGAYFLYEKLSDSMDNSLLSGITENTEDGNIDETPKDPDDSDGAGDSDNTGEPDNTDDTNDSADSNSTENTDNPDESDSSETEPVTAPDFTVTDSEGNQVKLSDFFGKPIIVNFWASWCGPCKSEMPDFDAAFAQYGEDIHFLMVNLTDGSRETVKSAQAYIEKEGYSFPIYYDTESSAATIYGVYSIPSTYFIDENGYPIAYAKGALDSAALQQGIDMILPKE